MKGRIFFGPLMPAIGPIAILAICAGLAVIIATGLSFAVFIPIIVAAKLTMRFKCFAQAGIWNCLRRFVKQAD